MIEIGKNKMNLVNLIYVFLKEQIKYSNINIKSLQVFITFIQLPIDSNVKIRGIGCPAN